MSYKQTYITDEVELVASTVSLREDGIFQIEMKSIGREIIEKDIRELTESIGIIWKGAKYPVLLITKHLNTLSKDAGEYAASEIAGRYTLTNAILVKSAVIGIGANFFINIFKPARPTTVFNEESKAIAWPQTFI